MAIRTDFLLQQIERFAERLGQLLKASGRRPSARIAEGLTELWRDMEDFDHELSDVQRARFHRIKAETLGELGMIDAQVGDADRAYARLFGAIELAEEVLESDDEDSRIFVGTLLLNAGALAAARRQFERAAEQMDRAIDRLHPLIRENTNAEQLWMTALANRATAREQRGDLDGAMADSQTVREWAQSRLEAGNPNALVPLTEQAMRLSGLLGRADRHERALEMAALALETASRAADEEVGPFQALFLRAKLAMADACVGCDRFADAEDHLFEAIDTIPELVDSVLFGADLYARLLSFDDDRLEDGGLPRDEVEESYAELLAQLDARCPDDLICKLARARYDVLVNGRFEPAEALLEGPPLPRDADPRARTLQVRLAEALEAAQGGESTSR